MQSLKLHARANTKREIVTKERALLFVKTFYLLSMRMISFLEKEDRSTYEQLQNTRILGRGPLHLRTKS